MAQVKNRNDESQMEHNHQTAKSQRDKTIFRAHKVAMSADPFNPNRLTSNNSITPGTQVELA